MSRDVASLVYSRKCGSMARKAVLAYFAERANDDGAGIWASKQRIAYEIECSKQTVITVVKALEADGLIRVTGKHKTQGGHTVIYAIDLAQIKALPVAKLDLNQSSDLTPLDDEPVKPLDRSNSGPVKPLDPDQSSHLTQTVHEPSIEEGEAKASPSSARAMKSDPFPKPDWADPQVWADFMDNRKAKKARNTATAYSGFLGDVAKLASDQWPPGKLLEHAAAKGWAGIYEPRSEQNGRISHQQHHTAPNGRAMGRTEAAVRAVTGSAIGPGQPLQRGHEPIALPNPMRAVRHVV